MFKRPIVAFDGSEPSLRALNAGIEFAALIGEPLRVVIVEEGLPPHIQLEALASTDARVVEDVERQSAAYVEGLVGQVETLASVAGVTAYPDAVAGNEVDAIVDAVRRHACDLLIVGLRHHPGLLERLVPQTARTLTERVSCSVLGVR